MHQREKGSSSYLSPVSITLDTTTKRAIANLLESLHIYLHLNLLYAKRMPSYVIFRRHPFHYDFV